MQEPFIAVQVVTWNSMPYLQFCLESLTAQTYKHISITIIDNASTDGISEYLATAYPHISIIKNTTNRGFAAAHNQGITWHIANSKWPKATTYIFVLNPDVILTPSYLEHVVKIMQREPKAAGITGQLLRYQLKDGNVITTTTIDSEGLEVLPWRAVRERHAGHRISNFEFRISNLPPQAVWGISGACALYRISALEDVKQNEEYFDQDFFCYKEDVDMCWRMRTRGWKFLFTPTAQAFHKRGIGHDTPHTQRNPRINQWSYRNHWYTLIKNETWHSFLVHVPLVAPYEMAKFCYYLVTQPRTLLSLYDVCINFTRMLRKRA